MTTPSQQTTPSPSRSDVSSRDSSKPRRFPIPCLDCGRLHTRAVYCEIHERPVLYRGRYRQEAAYVRANAITCHLCGKGADATDPWTADHVLPGDPDSPLQAAHRSCNSRRGDK